MSRGKGGGKSRVRQRKQARHATTRTVFSPPFKKFHPVSGTVTFAQVTLDASTFAQALRDAATALAATITQMQAARTAAFVGLGGPYQIGIDLGESDMLGARTAYTPAGFVAYKGRGVYEAKERLKQLGGYWLPEQKAWIVPEAQVELADQQVLLGRLANGVVLERDPDLPEIVPVSKRVPMMTCWQCGQSVPILSMDDPDNYYCGCVERERAYRRTLAAKRKV